jgi:hypothetical protein
MKVDIVKESSTPKLTKEQLNDYDYIGVIYYEKKYMVISLGNCGSEKDMSRNIVITNAHSSINQCYFRPQDNIVDLYEKMMVCGKKPEIHVFDTKEELYQWMGK